MTYARVTSGEPRSTQLHLTGERTVPGIAQENYWYQRHEAAYQALLGHAAVPVVLEAGCGEGYGAALFAATAGKVIGLDYDQPSTTHAGRTYPEVHAALANLVRLPVATSTIDVVATLQTIEHLWDQHGFLTECARVLRPNGKLLVTTPNRLTFTPTSDKPLNPYHTREFAPSELNDLLHAAGFRTEANLGLHHGPALRTLDERYGGSIIDAQLEVVFGQLPGQAVWPEQLLADVAAIRAHDFTVHGRDIESSLDLVTIAVRR